MVQGVMYIYFPELEDNEKIKGDTGNEKEHFS